MRKLLKMIFNRWTLIALGLLALSLLIWWVAPAIKVFELAPFAPEWTRWTLIVLMCALVIVKALWKAIRARRASAAIADGLARPAASPGDPRDEEGQALAERFNTALELLKKTNLEKVKRSPLTRFRSILTGSYLYDLPWYVLIGAPGSGKTTALVNSGLHFPLSRGATPAAIAGVGGTRYCDWWFTEEAVMIDNAGRYTTHDSDAKADKQSWLAFLDLLKKNRPRQP